MKKVLSLFSLLIVTGFFATFTQNAFAATPITEVTGIVKDANGHTDSGVNVTAVCKGISHSATTGSNGSYQIIFSQADDCTTADNVSVSGSKGSDSGGGSGQVHQQGTFGEITLNFSVVDFSVPEFTTMLGLVAGLTSLGGYLALRKRSV